MVQLRFSIIILVFLISDVLCDNYATFRFANHYADHMVLQRSPQRAFLWGYSNTYTTISVSVKHSRTGKKQTYRTKTYIDSRGFIAWKIALEPYKAGGPYDIICKSNVRGKSIRLRDVLFGDVWFCSGQSNMVFPTSHAMEAEKEMDLAQSYPQVRLFEVGRYFSNVTIHELKIKSIHLQWSLPTPKKLSGFSALCWMYGRRLFDQYHVPIGLISSNFGGTRIEAWSSPDMLKKCKASKNDQNSPSALWNAMVYPLLTTTIYGVIWYQGESNVDHPDTYNCTFPAMIAGWRKEWYKTTGKSTDSMFPFGFVQIAVIGKDYPHPKFPIIRWKQTAEYGYVPNPKQPKTFMAVAMDLPDNATPFDTIHPRYKSDIADRLVLGALNIAYNEETYWTGPVVDKVKLSTNCDTNCVVTITYKKETLKTGGIEIRTKVGFEISFNESNKWTGFDITSHKKDRLYITIRKQPSDKITAVRYAWKQEPCLLKLCAVYGARGNLPSPPFIAYGPFP
ncbi:sialate O-acetylesterase-like [Hydractinia symbiolongicarpus]|uniref:sialate O-acetylesterase-like n=1 Tax=Hydractinia symbiolongicarpus TaxID=13093 RepID=UPI00254ADB5C|nr:sialate O-acetylesterase-like [Hydractinia symbiolongicarpus]